VSLLIEKVARSPPSLRQKPCPIGANRSRSRAGSCPGLTASLPTSTAAKILAGIQTSSACRNRREDSSRDERDRELQQGASVPAVYLLDVYGCMCERAPYHILGESFVPYKRRQLSGSDWRPAVAPSHESVRDVRTLRTSRRPTEGSFRRARQGESNGVFR
jgi:hypothetical protein